MKKIKSSGGILGQMKDAGKPMSSLDIPSIRKTFEKLSLVSPSENREMIMGAEYLLGISDEYFISIYKIPPKNIRFIGGSKTFEAIEKRKKELGL